MKNEKKFNNEKLKLFFSLVFYLIIFFSLYIPVYGQFSASIGYSYVSMYSYINTNFLPFIGLSYVYSSPKFSIDFGNYFYYSLDNFFIDKLNLDLLFNIKNNTYIQYSAYYIPFNIFLIDDNYYTGNFIFTKFNFQSFNKVQLNFSLSAEYDQLSTTLIDSPLNFIMEGLVSLPFSTNILTNYLNIEYKTDDNFEYSLVKAIYSSKIIFTPSINEMIIPKISLLGGYSFNNTSGNFYGFSISNLFFYSISNVVNFSSELYLQYTDFLTSVLTDDIDYSEITENLLFTIKYSNFVNSSHQLKVKLLYFPQEAVPSTLNRSIIELQNTIFYSSSKIFIIDFLSSIQYTYWFLQHEENSLDLFFELILKFIPNQNLSLLLLNDVSTTFSSSNEIIEIYAQIKFFIIYYIIKNLAIEGLLSYKNLSDKANDQYFEYFFINISLKYTF